MGCIQRDLNLVTETCLSMSGYRLETNHHASTKCRSLTNVESRKPSRRRWHFTWVLKRDWVSSRKRRAFQEKATTEVKAWGYEKLRQLWKIEGCCSLSHRMLKVQGRRPLFQGVFFRDEAWWNLQKLPTAAPKPCSAPQVLPRLSEVPRAVATPTHSHPPRRVASQKERGRGGSR